jgi:hypothetical protein
MNLCTQQERPVRGTVGVAFGQAFGDWRGILGPRVA